MCSAEYPRLHTHKKKKKSLTHSPGGIQCMQALTTRPFVASRSTYNLLCSSLPYGIIVRRTFVGCAVGFRVLVGRVYGTSNEERRSEMFVHSMSPTCSLVTTHTRDTLKHDDSRRNTHVAIPWSFPWFRPPQLLTTSQPILARQARLHIGPLDTLKPLSSSECQSQTTTS
jgi:hypothetical protein